jgi:uncharacterized protein
MDQPIDIPRVLKAVLEQYTLPPEGDHGVAHWARVFEIGERLAVATGASLAVVQLFAVLHDSRRLNEGTDPDHGPRAAEFAETLRGTCFDLDDLDFERLVRACRNHTHVRTDPDVTVQTCFDSDRLDLGRVGIFVDPYYLSTAASRDPSMIRWASGRAQMHFVPELVSRDWGIELPSDPFA